MAPPGWSPSSMRGTAARTSAWPAETLKRNASSRKRGDVSRKGRGMVPPMLLTMMSSRPNSLCRGLGQRGHEVEVGQVAGDDDGTAPGGLDLLGDISELVLGPGGQDDVGPGLGQGHRGAGPDAAPAGGDDGDLVRHEELVEDHPANVVGRRGRPLARVEGVEGEGSRPEAGEGAEDAGGVRPVRRNHNVEPPRATWFPPPETNPLLDRGGKARHQTLTARVFGYRLDRRKTPMPPVGPKVPADRPRGLGASAPGGSVAAIEGVRCVATGTCRGIWLEDQRTYAPQES